MVADKKEECGVMQMEVLSYSRGGQHWHKERWAKSSNTAETGEETFRNGATRTAGPPDCASGVQDEFPFHS